MPGKNSNCDATGAAGLFDKLGSGRFFRTDYLALEYAWAQIGNNHEADCPLNVVCPVNPAD